MTTTKYAKLPDSIAQRDRLLLDALGRGDVLFTLRPVQLGGGRLTIYATTDAIRFGDPTGDTVRLGMSSKGQAELLERLELMHHTPLTADASALQAYRDGGLVGPFVRGHLGITSDRESMTTGAMVRHSREIDDALREGFDGMVCAWKRRVLSIALWDHHGRQANYGWWLLRGTRTAPAPVHPALTTEELVVIQTLQTGHSAVAFADYSEMIDGISWHGELDGEAVDLRDVITGKLGRDVARLLSHEGPLPDWRPPYADEVAVISDIPPTCDHGTEDNMDDHEDIYEPDPATDPAPERRVLRLASPWMRGDDVAMVQKRVGAVVDAAFGPDTEAAVKAFQRGRGLPDTGEVDAETWAAIEAPIATDIIAHGLDVSVWQKPEHLDWQALAEDFDFVIARACYGTKPDATFPHHVAGAQAAGLTTGGYLFYHQSQPWKRQLEAFVEQLRVARLDEEGSILPVVDLEWNERHDGPLNVIKHRTDARLLCEALVERYGGCLLYLAPGFFQQLGKPAWMLEHPWWIAHYTDADEPWCPWVDWAIWQHSGKGRLEAYARGKRDIDLNRARRLPVIGG